MTRNTRTFGPITFYGSRHRRKTDHMGRFGGGWQYKVGITAGAWHKGHGITLLVALFTDEYRIQIRPLKRTTP